MEQRIKEKEQKRKEKKQWKNKIKNYFDDKIYENAFKRNKKIKVK